MFNIYLLKETLEAIFFFICEAEDLMVISDGFVPLQ